MSDIRLALPIGWRSSQSRRSDAATATTGNPPRRGDRSHGPHHNRDVDYTGLPKLIGTVGSTDDPDAYEIRLTTEDGAEVTTTLPPGEYMLEINDPSTIHNFHLGGPRAAVDVASDVAGTGEKTAIVLLQERVVHLHSATRTRPG